MLKTIIVYATKHGTVKKAVDQMLEQLGGSVEVCDVGEGVTPEIEEYDTVIIGGSIYMGKIQNELTRFMNENLDVLLSKRVGLFLCAGHPDPVQLEKELDESFPEVLAQHSFAKEIFGYEFDFGKMNFVEKFMIKKITGLKDSHSAMSNEKIRDFVQAIM